METTILTLIVLAIGGYLLYSYYPDIMKYFGREGFADTPTGVVPEYGPSVEDKIKVAVARIMEYVTTVISRYGTATDEDISNMSRDINTVADILLKKVMSTSDPDAELVRIGGEELINKAIKDGKVIIYKLGSPEGAEMLEGDLKLKLGPEINDILNFNNTLNELSISNIISDQTDVRKRIGGDNIFEAIWKDQTGKSISNVRYVEPIEKPMKGKVDLTKMRSSNVIDVLTADNPTLFNNNQLLPNLQPKDLNERPINMELANIIASQNRFYEDGARNVVRNRGGDTRPLPKALIDKIMTQGNTRDPNSLQMAARLDLIDVLETGRGVAGNEYLDYAIDTYYRANNSEFIKETEQVAANNLRKTGSLVSGRAAVDGIIADIKGGKKQPEVIDKY